MVDRPPPNRFSVVERGGRLVVIDKETGRTPPTAAERMDAHDRELGVEPIRPERLSATPDLSAAARAESGLSARPAPGSKAERPAAPPTRPPMAAAVAEMNNKRPWSDAANEPSRRRPQPQAARIAQRPPPQAGVRKTIVTGKWWDAKGPRTIELGPKGQAVLSGGFITLFVVAFIAAIVLMVVQPLLLFVGAFLLFRFGGTTVLGPVGASLVDKALAERG